METPFQVDKFHFNNCIKTNIIGDYYSGFSLEDQSKVFCIVFNEEILTESHIEELQRINLILAQKENDNVLRPLAWGAHEGRHYVAFPEFGTQLSSYENLGNLKPEELLMILRHMLKALCFAASKEVNAHGSIQPQNLYISLKESKLKLGFFGYPTLELTDIIKDTDVGETSLAYMPPDELVSLGLDPYHYDLYAVGLIGLELATAQTAAEIIDPEDRLDADVLRSKIGEQDNLPLPLQELLFKLLTPIKDDRYVSFQQALDDVVRLAGEEEDGLSFQTFILDTLINGRFRLGGEIATGRVSHVYSARDLRAEPDGEPCVVKLIDLRSQPGMAEVFHTKFKQLVGIKHEHLLEVYDVGVHFENGYMAMETGLVSLEDLLIKRGTLPLTDAGRIIFQLCKALEGLHFNQIQYHGAIKPSNVFLTTDLRTVKLGDALVADYFLRNGNLNYIGAEYYNPEFIKNVDCDVRSDLYNLGTLFFEMMVGHPPFSFKIEQEIIDDHLHLSAASRIENALFSNECKDIIMRLLEKNPAVRYPTVKELKEELTVLLGYDKKEEVELPYLLFDFAELSMVGKNAREKSEETLAIRLPAVSNRARGAVALLIGHGKGPGDLTKAATSALKSLREMLFNPGGVSKDFAKLQKADPEKFLMQLMEQMNQRIYREAFASGKTKKYGLSAAIGIVQENTLYLSTIGVGTSLMFNQGELIDQAEDKWTIEDELELGDKEKALSSEVHDRLGYGEMFRIHRLKRRLQDGDQLVMVSPSLMNSVSINEVKELITSSSEVNQAIELVRGDAIRRRLEGTISCVLTSVGNVRAFADDSVSHSKKGMLARNFLSQGDSYLNDGQIDDAIEQYNKALEINPNFSIIHHQLGVAYVRKGLSSYAQSCFERAIELNQKLAPSYVEVVRLLQNQRRNREVLPLLRQAVANGCKDADLFALLGKELLKVRNYDEAMLYTSYALDLNPTHPTAFRDRMLATKRRNALDTKLLKMFASRPRLADDKRGTITENPPEDNPNE